MNTPRHTSANFAALGQDGSQAYSLFHLGWINGPGPARSGWGWPAAVGNGKQQGPDDSGTAISRRKGGPCHLELKTGWCRCPRIQVQPSACRALPLPTRSGRRVGCPLSFNTTALTVVHFHSFCWPIARLCFLLLGTCMGRVDWPPTRVSRPHVPTKSCRAAARANFGSAYRTPFAAESCRAAAK